MPSPEDTQAYSLWLMPHDDDAARLDALIAELAPTFGSAAFRAHITVQGDLATPAKDLRRTGQTLALACPSLDWHVTGVAASPNFFRSLYVGLQFHISFEHLKSSAARLTGCDTGISPFPHISLAYGEPEREELKHELLNRFADFARETPKVRVDHLALALSSKTLPIGEWRILETFPLRPPRTAA